jgi:iron complex outermembrane receptor protein
MKTGWKGARAPARSSLRLRLLAGGAALSLSASGAFAQEAPAQPGQSPRQATATELASSVGEIVVTARRRAESLQEVPVAVDVVSGPGAAAHNLNNIEDISSIVPSVDFRTSASNKDRTVFIRGIGTISTSPGVEPSVSTVVDGVVLARTGMATLDLVDIDHIEVLEGPQGTLFGKNASAGVVNIVTANPTGTPHGFATAGWYQGGEYRTSLGASGPIIGDKLEGLIEGFTAQYRGNVENIFDGIDKEVNGYRHTGGRVKFIANPTDNLKLTLGGDFTDSSDSTPSGVFTEAGITPYEGTFTPSPALAASLAGSGVTPGPDNRTISDNTNTSVHDKNAGVNLQADWTPIEGYTVTSITAFRKWNNTQYQDYDQLAAPTAATPGLAALPQGIDTGLLDFKQTSEEVRLTSPKGKFVDYVVGLYYLHAVDNETYSRAIQQIPAVDAAPVNNLGVAHYGTTDDNFAVYGEANFNLTKKLRLIAGGRGVWDWLSYFHNRVSTSPIALPGVATSVVNPPPGGPSPQDNVGGYSDRFGVQYDVTRDVMAYFTYSRGYKGPAYDVFFNMVPGAAPTFFGDRPLAPETSNDFEAGLKTTLFDQKVRANVTAFIEDFNNYQANFTQEVAGGLVTTLVNAGSVSTRGIEANIAANPIDQAHLDIDALYDDARIDDFPCPPGAAFNCNVNGQPLPFAPRYKVHLGGDYRVFRTDQWDVQLESNYTFTSTTQYQLTEQPSTIQPGYGIWNADIALLGRQNGWQARFLAMNLLNTHYSPYLAPSDVGGGVVRWVPRDDNRYVGVNLRKDF